MTQNPHLAPSPPNHSPTVAPLTPERADQFRQLAELSRKAAMLGNPDALLETLAKWNARAHELELRAEQEKERGRVLLARVFKACATTYRAAAADMRRTAEKVRGNG